MFVDIPDGLLTLEDLSFCVLLVMITTNLRIQASVKDSSHVHT